MQKERLVDQLQKIPSIEKIALKYKEDRLRGEIIFYVTQKTGRNESESEFSPVFIKTIFHVFFCLIWWIFKIRK